MTYKIEINLARIFPPDNLSVDSFFSFAIMKFYKKIKFFLRMMEWSDLTGAKPRSDSISIGFLTRRQHSQY